MDLKSKLNMYKSNAAAPANITPSKPVVVRNSGCDVHELMDGTVCSNGDGSYFMLENRYPTSYLHGGCSLGDAACINMNLLTGIFPGLEENEQLKEYLFLDTETTGLSSGTGTVAFLIGVGYFEEDSFILRQYFMRDYDEEPAMLRDLAELLGKYKGLVTFNGKSFDWNLLQTRFTSNRIRPGLKEPRHIDLLYPSRRIWKLKLESCRLSVLEECILGESRVDDIPGAMIPSVYFKYLDDRNAADIKRVIKHNESDILSMVSLIVRITAMLQNPLTETDGEHELLGIGRIMETAGLKEVVSDCYESCLSSENVLVRDMAAKRLIDLCKKKGDYRKAADYCEQVLTNTRYPDMKIMVELAKHYEHREKDIGKAAEIVEEAISLSLKLGLRDNQYYLELKKRLERLKRKAARTDFFRRAKEDGGSKG